LVNHRSPGVSCGENTAILSQVLFANSNARASPLISLTLGAPTIKISHLGDYATDVPKDCHARTTVNVTYLGSLLNPLAMFIPYIHIHCLIYQKCTFPQLQGFDHLPKEPTLHRNKTGQWAKEKIFSSLMHSIRGFQMAPPRVVYDYCSRTIPCESD
jgi:hypothetical protein